MRLQVESKLRTLPGIGSGLKPYRRSLPQKSRPWQTPEARRRAIRVRHGAGMARNTIGGPRRRQPRHRKPASQEQPAQKRRWIKWTGRPRRWRKSGNGLSRSGKKKRLRERPRPLRLRKLQQTHNRRQPRRHRHARCRLRRGREMRSLNPPRIWRRLRRSICLAAWMPYPLRVRAAANWQLTGRARCSSATMRAASGNESLRSGRAAPSRCGAISIQAMPPNLPRRPKPRHRAAAPLIRALDLRMDSLSFSMIKVKCG